MAVLLGIDTGGTFTDAVLFDTAAPIDAGAQPDRSKDRILAVAKAPTTPHDLAVGLRAAVAAVLTAGARLGVGSRDIVLVSVSTTLATNAIVEGHGRPAAVLAFGFGRDELTRAGLDRVVAPDHVAVFPGGHDAHGNARAAFPEDDVRRVAATLGDRVSAFAVTAQFGVRNPEHELAAAAIAREVSGRPVTCGHELSARLDGPRRALTAALNAGLLDTIDRLHRAVRATLADHRIEAPLMVVRGDGSLVSAQFAATRPIETVLSGPAASVIGGVHLAGDRVRDRQPTVVVDIGGTTTDVAVVVDGRPGLAADGALVAGHRTMVEAVDMATVGIGGDSEVVIDTRAASGPIVIGPARAIPLGRLAADHPAIVHELRLQLDAPTGVLDHARFAIATGAGVGVPGSDPSTRPADPASGVDARQARLLERLGAGPVPLASVVRSALEGRALAALRERGVVRIATITPTDALAVLEGRAPTGLDDYDIEAARLGLDALARQTSTRGGAIAPDGRRLAERIVDTVIRRSASFVLRTGLRRDGVEVEPGASLLEASLDGHRATVAVQVDLGSPLVAIGAPAPHLYPAVAECCGTTAVVPEHAAVANAVGAVVGHVRMRRSCTITQPTKGQFRLHLDDQPTFGSIDNARTAARERLERAVEHDARTAGAGAVDVDEDWSSREAMVDGKAVFVEGTLTVTAHGRPALGA